MGTCGSSMGCHGESLGARLGPATFRCVRCILTIPAIALVLACAAPASAGEPGTVEGQILDTTCPGPCIEGMKPKPYTGEAKIVVTRFPKQRQVRVLAPEADGSFAVRLPPGHYRLRIRIEDPCFIEDKRELRVSTGGDIDRPDFFVYNDCIK